ncbi:AraC family transcriptional regulator [Herbiconiux sp. CPCC 203407]|uniref:AraC family transcriptional regulator n=1 Tax=Herbiconiux oxytropis TaxID=2970915 RepID=A0AA41XJS4_9MICO|nr:AraC family transcriptional regulator [Herbiconiux oxytropis]MCS5723220.1 AraC family transcriptional regulator [Herbiconiux oxytropis]MCS5727875.1 AraC family transcriptional regulator [Herbiconiux oxytropis]
MSMPTFAARPAGGGPREPERFRADTVGIDPAARAEYWHEIVTSAHTRLNATFAGSGGDRRDYHGRLTYTRSRSGQIARWSAREPLNLVRTDTDDERPLHQVLVPLRGSLFKGQGSNEAFCSPGQLTVIDQARPYVYDQREPLTAVMLTVPSDRLRAAVGGDPPTATTVDVRSGIGRLFVRTLVAASSDTTMTEAQFDLVCRQLTELTGAFVQPERMPGSSPGRAAAYRAALAYIDAHLDEMTLSLDEVARVVRASPRYVQLVFRENGTTVRAEIRRRRLERARRLLESPGSAPATIAGVAHASGFGSAGVFSAQFKAEFGLSPAEARARSIVR